MSWMFLQNPIQLDLNILIVHIDQPVKQKEE